MTDLREKVAQKIRGIFFDSGLEKYTADSPLTKRYQFYNDAAQAALDTVFAELMSDEVLRVACATNNLNFPTMICINGMEAALSAAIAQLKGE